MDSFIQISNFPKIAPYAQLFRQGLLVTVLLSAFTVAIGFVIALLLALMRLSNVRPFRFLGLDKDGHQKEEGVLAAISRFQSAQLSGNGICRNSSFDAGYCTDLHYLLWRVQL